MKTGRGFSMIELMVAMTLALLILGGALSIFAGVRNVSGSASGISVVADNGRYALNFIQQTLRSAGFMSCNSTLRQTSVLAAGPGPSPLNFDFTEAVGGFEATGSAPGNVLSILAAPLAADGSAGDWAGSGGSSLDPALTGAVIQGSDIVAAQVTAAGSPTAYLTAPTSLGTTTLVVGNAAGFGAGQMAVISDCVKSEAFQVSSGGASTIGAGAGGGPGNATSLQNTYGPGAQVSLIDTVVYYIGVGADGDGALMMLNRGGAAAFQPAQELVPDIENMQVLYGIDTNGTQTVSRYVTADQVAAQGVTGDFNSVISMRLAVLAASPPGTIPLPPAAPTYTLLGTVVTAPIDTRLRKVFDLTIYLRNTGV